jgi:preprotein translocase SecE subunit
MLVLILSVAVSIDLGIWAYSEFEAGLFGSEDGSIIWFRAIKLVVYGFFALFVLVYGLRSALFSPKNAQFLIEVEQETAKVTLPRRQEVIRSTVIIAIGTAVMAFVLFLVDTVNLWLLDQVHALGGGL